MNIEFMQTAYETSNSVLHNTIKGNLVIAAMLVGLVVLLWYLVLLSMCKMNQKRTFAQVIYTTL
jgi:hypothetical protein